MSESDSSIQKQNIDTACEDSVQKKVKTEGVNRISRKTSDDLIKYFERLPDDQINKLLTYMKNSNTRI